jgi:hypothetical protein
VKGPRQGPNKLQPNKPACNKLQPNKLQCALGWMAWTFSAALPLVQSCWDIRGQRSFKAPALLV